jgi:hypothetical protein
MESLDGSHGSVAPVFFSLPIFFTKGTGELLKENKNIYLSRYLLNKSH